MLADGRWSRDYEACVKCGTSNVKHRGYGHCWNCYNVAPQVRALTNKSNLKYKEKYSKMRLDYIKRFRETNYEEARRRENIATFKHMFNGKRDEVLELYDSRCSDCGVTREEHKRTKKSDLCVVHYDRNRKNNKLDNLRPLCRSCFARWWVKKDQPLTNPGPT